MTRSRLPEIDFVKCVCITLMVVMHLQYIGDTYPVAKAVVYTFHMPLFLFLSGFLLRTDRTWRSFAAKYAGVLVPYLIMESGYAIASVYLSVRGGLSELTPLTLLRALVLKPVGPYWYLHTFMLCSVCCYAVRRSLSALRSTDSSQLLPIRRSSACQSLLRLLPAATTLVLLCVSSHLQLVYLPYALYFWAGTVAHDSGLSFAKLFPARLGWIVLLVVLLCFDINHRADSAGGVAVCYCMMCFLSYLSHCRSRSWASVTSYIGAHTLSILLFSPLFTLAAKYALPYLLFEPTGVLFMVVSTVVAIAGSLCIEQAMHCMGVARYFFCLQRTEKL